MGYSDQGLRVLVRRDAFALVKARLAPDASGRNAGVAKANVEIGTIGGSHTMQETRQLIAAKDALINQISDAFVRSGWTGDWESGEWRKDWLNFNQRWTAMKQSVSRAIVLKSSMTPGVPASLVPTEDQWQQVLRAINVSGTGLYTKGDLPDLQNRIENVLGTVVNSAKIPRQDGWDADLAIYQQADAQAKQIESAANQVRQAYEAAKRGAADKARDAIVPPLVQQGLLIGAAVFVAVAIAKLFSKSLV